MKIYIINYDQLFIQGIILGLETSSDVLRIVTIKISIISTSLLIIDLFGFSTQK
jgi:hypothetical protein